ncbi:hypothetical protein [Natronocella acetinitrilica]|nr:hypothetical protein [Natronocella acetinitrilica]
MLCSKSLPGNTVHISHRKVRYRGPAKNEAQLFSLFALTNLVLAQR